jgi:hypothetical protein
MARSIASASVRLSPGIAILIITMVISVWFAHTIYDYCGSLYWKTCTSCSSFSETEYLDSPEAWFFFVVLPTIILVAPNCVLSRFVRVSPFRVGLVSGITGFAVGNFDWLITIDIIAALVYLSVAAGSALIVSIISGLRQVSARKEA